MIIPIPRAAASIFFLATLTSMNFATAQAPKPEEVKAVMDRVLGYVNAATPVGIIDSKSGHAITDLKQPNAGATLVKSDYRIDSHEWGLAYSGMLLAHQVTGDATYKEYVKTRMAFLAQAVPYFQKVHEAYPGSKVPLEIVFNPQSLDDSGSLCAAMIKATRAGMTGLQPIIDNNLEYIMTRQYRLRDGTFARNRPLPNTVWADDLYQSIPALAQAGSVTADGRYFDESIAQIQHYANTVFNREKNVYMHAWVQDMETHPEFY